MSTWRECRAEVLNTARRVVVKVGSAVLTGPVGLDLRVVNRLADQLAVLHDRGVELVLVSSGAVAAGRRTIRSTGREPEFVTLREKQAASAVGQSRLMHEYDEAFARYGKTSAQILLTRDDFQSRQRFLNARNTVSTLLEWGVIPVINENDSVAVAELMFGDNDYMASMVLGLVDADLFVNLTSEAGVYEANPRETPEARRLECIENIAGLDLEVMCQGASDVGSGGMYSKLQSAHRAAQLAVPTIIVSGREPFALEKVFAGENLGTWIAPCQQAVSKRKFWMAYHADPAGSIRVDPGAARALTSGGKSLLPAGIVSVEGDFDHGDLVTIMDAAGRVLGVGLSNYSTADLGRIKGRQSSDIAAILGADLYPEVVHRDNMFLDPAL